MNGEPLKFHQVRMPLLNIVNQALQREVAKEVVKDIRGIKPWPIHPKMMNFDLIENANKPSRVVVVCVRQHHVVDVIPRVELVDVVDDGFRRFSTASIDHMKAIALGVVAVADNDRVSGAFPYPSLGVLKDLARLSRLETPLCG